MCSLSIWRWNLHQLEQILICNIGCLWFGCMWGEREGGDDPVRHSLDPMRVAPPTPSLSKSFRSWWEGRQGKGCAFALLQYLSAQDLDPNLFVVCLLTWGGVNNTEFWVMDGQEMHQIHVSFCMLLWQGYILKLGKAMKISQVFDSWWVEWWCVDDFRLLAIYTCLWNFWYLVDGESMHITYETFPLCNHKWKYVWWTDAQ